MKHNVIGIWNFQFWNFSLFSSASHINRDIIQQGGDGTQSGNHISSGSPFQGILCSGMFLLGQHSFVFQPSQGAIARIILYWKSHNRKQGSGGKNHDSYQQKRWKRFDHQDSSQQNPLHIRRRHIDNGHQLRTQSQPTVGRGVLHRVTAFMGGNCCRGCISLVVNGLT